MSSTVQHLSCGSILDFTSKINNRKDCIRYLRELGLLPSDRKCKMCMRSMTLVKKPIRVTSDLEQWGCRKCKSCISIRDGSIFKVINML